MPDSFPAVPWLTADPWTSEVPVSFAPVPWVPLEPWTSEMPVSMPALPVLPPEPAASDWPVSLAVVPAAELDEPLASGSASPSPVPLFLPAEKVMTSEAALFLLMAAAGLPGSVLGRAGGVPGFGWLTITISGVGLAWNAGSQTIWPPLAARPTTRRPANNSPESRSDQLDRDMRASPSSEVGAPIAIDVSVTCVFPPATFS